MPLLDPLILARIQFAFTISFHIIFPAFTIGLASFLAVVEWRWLRTGDERFIRIYKFWIKIFAVAFGMGVVSGVVMSYQFGTNWSIFSDKVASVIGPLLGFEVLIAFFLEASFLGIMLFGWGRVSKRMHFAASCIVAIGTLCSAFWILSANSWMQTPQGFTVGADGRLLPVNWLQIVFNPSFPYRLTHMVIASYLSTAFVVGGVASFYLWKKRYVEEAKLMLQMATLLVAIFAPIQIFVGDFHGLNTLKYQPAKIAALEGIWDTEKGAGFHIFAIPHDDREENSHELVIPKLGSLILTHKLNGEIRGLKSWPKQDRPSMMIFWPFRVMAGLGFLMAFLGLTSAWLFWRRKLFSTPWLHKAWMLMMPSGFIAILSGWFVTEIGRQPYTAYGVLRTIDSVSPALVSAQLTWSLISFVIIYSFVFGAGSYYILKLIAKGISTDNHTIYYEHGMEASVVEGTSSEGEKNV